jgi:signal transduction histidine kinase
MVGRNLSALLELRGFMRRALVQTVVLTLLLGFGGGYLFSRRVATRLDRVNVASRGILSGAIDRRLPVSSHGDEIDELCDNLNTMLDRIESLMDGMRSVTDNVAHDLRRPITRLRSRIELTLMGPRDAEAYLQALTGTLDELDELLTLFNAMLTIALAESGASRDFEEIDLADIVRSTAELYGPVAEDAGLALHVDAPAAVPCHGNPHLITQAVANLIDNSIKYAPGSGELTLATRADRFGARIIVADHGPGIPASFRRKAFDRFERLEPSRSAPGSGLGLSLVRAVARMHGGTATLDDNEPGTRVTLVLPREGGHVIRPLG